MQRQAAGAGLATAPPIVNDVLGAPGQPLDRATRAWAEPRFGHDFARVRVHADATAARSARAVDALAYTVGAHIAFAEGQYAPTSDAGRRLLAHELTHVVQQGGAASGPVSLPSPGEDRAAEHEAEAAAASGLRPALRARPGAVQRLTVDDCSATDATEVRQAAAQVDPRVRTTISKILAGTRAPDVDAALALYFGASATNYLSFIALRLAIINSRLPGATIECENPDSYFYDFFCGGALAYVRPVPAFFGLANIHLCQPDFHNLTPTQRMATLVHESAHRYNDADDEAYYTLDCQETAETRGLSDDDRRDNADSYGCLVQTLG